MIQVAGGVEKEERSGLVCPGSHCFRQWRMCAPQFVGLTACVGIFLLAFHWKSVQTVFPLDTVPPTTTHTLTSASLDLISTLHTA